MRAMPLHRTALAAVLLLSALLSTSATALHLVLESKITQCPCQFRVTGFASEKAPISVQVISAAAYRDWVHRGRPDDIVKQTSYLKPGKWSAEQRISSQGAWVLLVHSTSEVSAEMNQSKSSVSCPLKLSFTNRSPLTDLQFQSDKQLRLTATERIVNGARLKGDKTGAYNVLIRHGRKLCSGSLLAPYWVLTAAHCSMSAGHIVYAGVPAKKIEIAEVLRHPRFQSGGTFMFNDIALLRLKDEAPNANLIAISLNDNKGHQASDGYARVSGFGSSDDSQPSDLKLRAVDLPGISVDECRVAFRRSGYTRVSRSIDASTQICTDVDDCGRASCDGDSGGPLSVPSRNGGEAVQIGILSFSAGSCGSTPDVYTKVASFVDWIKETSGGEAKVVTL